MSKMQLRLGQDQVATIRRALADVQGATADLAYADDARRLYAWLTWRAGKLWGTGTRGEPLHKQAS